MDKFINEVKNILKESEHEIKALYKDSSVENPIKGDVELSIKAMAYEKILSKYKKYRKRGNE